MTYYVSLIDFSDVIPFVIKTGPKEEWILKLIDIDEYIKELTAFLREIEKKFGEKLHPLQGDIIGERYFYRVLFSGEGILEIANSSPCVIMAHFINKERAEKFHKTLKQVLSKILPKTKEVETLIRNVEFGEELAEINV